jgi:hypothetical protein
MKRVVSIEDKRIVVDAETDIDAGFQAGVVYGQPDSFTRSYIDTTTDPTWVDMPWTEVSITPEVPPKKEKKMEFRFHYKDGTSSAWGSINTQLIDWTGQMKHHDGWTIQKVEFR